MLPCFKLDALVACFVLIATTSVSIGGETVDLFNGKNFDGWVQHGGKAEYTIEGDVIVGTSVPDTPNSFLCTEKHYGDFILEVEFKVDPGLNSGVQIRSNVYDEDREVETKSSDGKTRKRKVAAGRVHGYQVEIDPSPRAWSGGIYDEGRRGWLNNLEGEKNKPAREAFKQNEWNHYKVAAIGDSIKTWINGVPAADLKDDMTPSGFIALQVHGIGKDQQKVGKQIRWRNIKLQEVKIAKADKQKEGKQYVEYKGKAGPGKGKKVVLIAGDEEYRSEEVLPQLGKILSQRHGFDCRVVFPIDPESGRIDPNYGKNIPGLEALEDADLMIILTRFRALPDDQMQYIDNYLKSGKPVIGMRTSTHAFNFPKESKWAHYGNYYNGEMKEWQDGFGRLVLGEHWISHHGKHKVQSTRGVIVEEQKDHPILQGVGKIWGPTDVYGVRLPLPGDSQPLVLGQVVNRKGDAEEGDPLYGMRETDTEPDKSKNSPMMPVVWTKTYELPHGKKGKVVNTTMGSSTDFLNEGVRRILVNAAYSLTGLENEIPETGTNVDIVGEFEPTAYEFRRGDYWPKRNMRVEEHELN
ncbi:family 16 glycoside hydrolase [Thalassoglobus sp.]|uniref:family 16 glycoside hydrolase n=1 Tax=Thalassoglobus sp. TaxID=2795869 RepID=UPI003AA90BFC